jgi:hypothetical protein
MNPNDFVTISTDTPAALKGCSYIYAPAGQAGEYAPLAANPYRGCGHGCAYCLDPFTAILMGDGRTKPLWEIQKGDVLIGVKQRGDVRRAWNFTYTTSTVLNKIETRKRAFRVTLDNGQSAICSIDHRWLTERGWKHTSQLTTKNSIRILGPSIDTPSDSKDYRLGYIAGVIRGDGTLGRYDYSGRYRRNNRKTPQKKDVQHHFRLAMNDSAALDRCAHYLSHFHIETTRFIFKHGNTTSPAIRTNSESSYGMIHTMIQPGQTLEWKRGWLAGIFDAEGGTSSGTLRIHNTKEDILTITQSALEAFGFKTTRDKDQPNGCSAVRILGGIAETSRFFNIAAPAIGRKYPLSGKALKGSARIIEITDLHTMIDMVDITTSTENFVANGMISHNCYVPLVMKMDRSEFDAGAHPRKEYLHNLRKDAKRYCAAGITEQVFFSFTTDVYQPSDRSLTRPSLQIVQEYGMAICVLTKGGARALEDIDLYRPERDCFASTLTSLDAAFSKKWERHAALPDDRIATLKEFHGRGIFTWVSLEPTLDVESSLAIVEATHGFVDLLKIGRANYLKEITRTTDWESYTHRMIDLCQKLGIAHYIKRDLQPFLPKGYPNPLRVKQHH